MFSRSGGVCVLAGGVFVVSHPPVGLWPLVFLALIPPMLVTRGRSWWGGFGFGYLYGLVIEGGGTYWIGGTITEYHRVYMTSGDSGSLWSSLFGWTVFAAWWLGAAGLWGLWGGLLTMRRGRTAFSFAWPVVTLVSLDAWYPRIFPWNVGAAVIEFPALAQPAYWFGTSVLTVLTVVVAGWLALGWELARGQDWRRAQRAILAAIATISVWAAVGEWRLGDESRAPKLRVGYVQSNISLEEKHGVDQGFEASQIAVFRQLVDLSADLLSREECDLLVWPEGMFFVGALDPDAVRALGVPVIVGTGGDIVPNKHQNLALLVTPDPAERIRVYAKRFLLVFGERFPFTGWLSALGVQLPGGLAAGEHTLPFDVYASSAEGTPAIRCGVSICFEGILEATGDHLVRDRSQVHINITEDLWYGRSSAPTQHLTLVALRAIESGVPVARVANGGISASIDRFGRFLELIPLGERATGVFELPAAPPNPTRPWLRWFGRLVPWLAPFAFCVLWLRRKRSSGLG